MLLFVCCHCLFNLNNTSDENAHIKSVFMENFKIFPGQTIIMKLFNCAGAIYFYFELPNVLLKKRSEKFRNKYSEYH